MLNHIFHYLNNVNHYNHMDLSENRYIPNYSHLIGIMIINHWV